MSAASAPRARRWPWALAVAAIVLAALLVRLWGIKQGLPYAYNADENAHFVPKAIGFFGHGYNPQYFINPPAYTYLLHAVFAVWFGGRGGVSHAYATDPTTVFVVARVTVAILGAAAAGLLYLAGARLFDRRVGLLAAALLAFAFLPTFYSHLALNDVPALAPAALSLVGTAGILRRGRWIDYLLAGGGLGLACATKYTGGIVLLPLLAVGIVQIAEPAAGNRRRAIAGLAIAGAVSLAAFVIANPYAVLDYSTFHAGLKQQSSASGDNTGKLGLTQDSGILYYLWTFTWGLGWVPALAAVGGAVVLLVRDRRLAAVLVPAPIVFVLFMGSQERYFGRWLLPILPVVCVLAAYGAVSLVDALARFRPRLRPALLALAAAALLGQALVTVVHSDLVLSRPDTRNLARDWMVRHIPPGAKIVVEPVMPDQWAQDPGRPYPGVGNGNRWIKFPTSRTTVPGVGTRRPGRVARLVNVEDYERTIFPALVATYEHGGWCWVVRGSTQSGRAYADPAKVPRAIAYYDTLRRRSTVAYRVSPYDAGKGPVDFNFDWSFDYYPLAYHRPGPEVTIYRLARGACARR